ncbi:MAG: NCS2 family permease [Bacteroidales bacterium]|nr:NCS2 family permease [Bacteroidales bacterium]
MERIRHFFSLKEYGTNIKTEILAGVSTFLALSYIFVVNPAILADGGMNKSAVLFATVITSAVATLAMGLWAKKPFVLAPGLEMNSYAVYYVILVLGFSWQNALGVVFWSGILFMILTLTRVREKITTAIPDSLKVGLSASVGIFLMIIALKLSGTLIYDGINIKGIGDLLTSKSLIFIVSLFLVIVLNRLKIRISVLLSIILATILAHFIGFATSSPSSVKVNGDMISAVLKLNFLAILDPKLLSALIILFVIDFYGSVAKFIGLTSNTNIVDENGNLPRLKETLSVDGYATILGSAMGTTSVTTYVESGVGIGVGGRTGLTAVICAILMFLFIPLAPLVNLVPVEATTGALFMVGLNLFPKPKIFKTWILAEVIAVLLMIIATFISFSLDKAMLVGFLSYVIGLIITKQFKIINPFLIISIVLLLSSLLLSVL